jgi:hypothetical protein
LSCVVGSQYQVVTESEDLTKTHTTQHISRTL